MSDTSVSVRGAAASSLGRLADRDATEALCSALMKDHSSRVRANAAHSLGVLKDERGLDPLITRINDADEEVRLAVANSLGLLGSSKGTSHLIFMLGDISVRHRLAAVHALGLIGDHLAIEPLALQFKRERFVSVRKQIVQTMAKFGGDTARATIVNALEDRDPSVQVVALDVIVGPDAILLIVGKLFEDNDSVRLAAAKSLERIELSGSPMVIGQVRSTLKTRLRTFGGDKNKEVRTVLGRVVKRYEQAMEGVKDIPLVATQPDLDSLSLPRPVNNDD